MTKEEILAMGAGNQLNAAVAKIMEDDLEHQWEEGPSQSGVKYCSRCNTYDWMPAAERPCSVKLYSEDISTAWQVVEELGGAWGIKRRFRPRPDDPPGSPGRPTYQAAVQISDYDPYEDEFFNKWSGRSPWCWTLPEAICKAALIARQNKN